jgi:3-deoxy-manno-octulosonate cytidylyltransferase (CMP-KDO synthetase)
VKPGDVILTSFLQADGREKVRPALVLRVCAPFDDLLICAISTRLQRQVTELDEVLKHGDSDYSQSGLREDSLIRLAYLSTIPAAAARHSIGTLNTSRLRRLLRRLAAYLEETSIPIRRVLGLIPARYASTRFPGKPLTPIAGKPLLQHVVERCQLATSLNEVIVATDDDRIAAVARKFARVEMTRPEHPSGTDRVAEVAERCACDAVVNIQGDEPLIDPAVINAVAGALARQEMSTAATPIRTTEDYDNPNVVKVVVNAAGCALYFSRRTIPYVRDAARGPLAGQLAAFPFLKHLGIYGYRRETLLRLVRSPVSPLERAEKLEQLRALENGIAIAVVTVNHDSVGVDAPEDVARVERLIGSHE